MRAGINKWVSEPGALRNFDLWKCNSKKGILGLPIPVTEHQNLSINNIEDVVRTTEILEPTSANLLFKAALWRNDATMKTQIGCSWSDMYADRILGFLTTSSPSSTNTINTVNTGRQYTIGYTASTELVPAVLVSSTVLCLFVTTQNTSNTERPQDKFYQRTGSLLGRYSKEGKEVHPMMDISQCLDYGLIQK
ncbi:hypothetical protein Tco_0218455 [Tanacetum coccineum]